MKLIIAVLATTLSGCMSMGVSQMTSEQIRAADGLATCSTIYTAWGKGASASVNVDNVRKGMTAMGKVVISPECAISIETNVGVAPPVSVLK